MKLLVTIAAAMLFTASAFATEAAAPKVDKAAGEAKYTAICAACHGADGNSPTPAFPRIGGQHPDYLLQALLDYKAGKRKNPIMAAQVEPLSKQDMADLAAWYGAQQGLYVKR